MLISPYALRSVNREERYIAVDLTKKQIEDSPPLGSDMPVSRQFEEAYYRVLWMADVLERPVRVGHFMGTRCVTLKNGIESSQDEKPWDPHLRSTQDVSGYHIQAADGEIGYVEDFVIDDEVWAIRYLIIDTRNWLPGKKVLVSPQWIERVSWCESKVFVNSSPRGTIRNSRRHIPDCTRLPNSRSIVRNRDFACDTKTACRVPAGEGMCHGDEDD